MEPKNRLFITIAVILLISVAMFTSFGRTLFMRNTPSVVLPSPASSEEDPLSPSQSDSGSYQTVTVTPGTVQNVIATLVRSSSYYRELTVENFWSEGSSAVSVRVWSDGGWTHCRQVLASGAVRHDLVGDATLYYWYDGSQQYETAPADRLSSDLAQRLPTYETVLLLDPESITGAGYELRGEQPCVYVEVGSENDARRDRYWVSVDSGLLISAEREENGQLIYRMTAYSPVTTPCPTSASFALPDGTVLHSIS